jgi:hypothetical protein
MYPSMSFRTDAQSLGNDQNFDGCRDSGQKGPDTCAHAEKNAEIA